MRCITFFSHSLLHCKARKNLVTKGQDKTLPFKLLFFSLKPISNIETYNENLL